MPHNSQQEFDIKVLQSKGLHMDYRHAGQSPNYSYIFSFMLRNRKLEHQMKNLVVWKLFPKFRNRTRQREKHRVTVRIARPSLLLRRSQSITFLTTAFTTWIQKSSATEMYFSCALRCTDTHLGLLSWKNIGLRLSKKAVCFLAV